MNLLGGPAILEDQGYRCLGDRMEFGPRPLVGRAVSIRWWHFGLAPRICGRQRPVVLAPVGQRSRRSRTRVAGVVVGS